MIAKLIVNTLAVFAAAYLLPGVYIASFTTAFLVAIVLGLLNLFVKPVLVLLTIPVTIVTLGLFLLVINALIVLLCAALVDGFRVDSWLVALVFSLLVSVFSGFMEWLAKDGKD